MHAPRTPSQVLHSRDQIGSQTRKSTTGWSSSRCSCLTAILVLVIQFLTRRMPEGQTTRYYRSSGIEIGTIHSSVLNSVSTCITWCGRAYNCNQHDAWDNFTQTVPENNIIHISVPTDQLDPRDLIYQIFTSPRARCDAPVRATWKIIL